MSRTNRRLWLWTPNVFLVSLITLIKGRLDAIPIFFRFFFSKQYLTHVTSVHIEEQSTRDPRYLLADVGDILLYCFPFLSVTLTGTY